MTQIKLERAILPIHFVCRELRNGAVRCEMKWHVVHGELLKLGFAVSERTVARYLRHLRPRIGKPDQRWKAFLANHREAIAARGMSGHVAVQNLSPAMLDDEEAVQQLKRQGPV